MLPIIVEAAIRSLLLAAAIWLGLKALRVTNPHILMAVWQLVLIISLGMPLLIHCAKFAPPPPHLPVPQMLVTEPMFLLSPAAPHPMLDDGAPSFDWRMAASAIYLAGAAFLTLRLFVGIALTWRLCRSARPVREDWTLGRDVRASDRVNVPVTFGSTIILPPNYGGWDATQRRAVMAHEEAHLRHGDFYVLLLAAINRAAFWFSPVAWWLNAQIAYLAEARSDAAAIANIEDRVRYAEILLSFGAKSSRATVALAMAGTSTVCRRVERVLAETMLPGRMNWKAWAAVAAFVLPLAAIAVGAVAQEPSQGSAVLSASPADIAGPLDQQTLRQRQDEQKMPRQEVPIEPATLDNYVGLYQFGSYRVFTVTRQDNQLFVQLIGQAPAQIFPESAQKFFYKTVAAQISFITDAQGHATALVLHQDGLERRCARIDEATAHQLQENFAKRLKGEAPMPGSETALRHQIDTFQHGEPDYAAMTDGLATITRPQVPRIERQFALLGALQSVSFRGVGFSGWDIYEAKFVNGIVLCRILLTPDAKIGGLRFEWGP